LKIEVVASFILLFSLFVPWTVTWGANTTATITMQFYALEFPFLAYYRVYSSQGALAWWEPYESAPKYLGMALILIGSILTIIGSTKQKRSALVNWGGISSILALIFFTGCNSASISIPYAINQTYTSLPLGMFIPALFWSLILFYPEEAGTFLKEIPKIFCGQCGREIPSELEFCPSCGAEKVSPACPVCGGEISAGYSFCPSCGARISK